MSRELDFERPVLELERRIAELRRIAETSPAQALSDQIVELEGQARNLRQEVMSRLSRWEVVQLSRHPDRPYALDYIGRIAGDFVELHGDRSFGDDGAIVGGVGRLAGGPAVLITQQKGRSTRENLERNFGMARPEGYRKAMRLMRLAERFHLPIVTLIDTPGAYPGIDAEARGQAQAIAESLEVMAGLAVPAVAVVIGEGGSGGALAIGVANRVLMLEFATYSVISPEACSSILFKDQSHAEAAADALKLTARDLEALGVVDEVIEEPPGGAHRDHDGAARALAGAIGRHLEALAGRTPDELRADRYARFRRLGAFVAAGARDSDRGGAS